MAATIRALFLRNYLHKSAYLGWRFPYAECMLFGDGNRPTGRPTACRLPRGVRKMPSAIIAKRANKHDITNASFQSPPLEGESNLAAFRQI